MPTQTGRDSGSEKWVRLAGQIRADFPHLGAWLFKPNEFGELRLKARDDGTVLGIAKGFGSDGGPVVAFGVGYDVVLALMALDATIAGDHWRFDKPWHVKGK